MDTSCSVQAAALELVKNLNQQTSYSKNSGSSPQ